MIRPRRWTRWRRSTATPARWMDSCPTYLRVRRLSLPTRVRGHLGDGEALWPCDHMQSRQRLGTRDPDGRHCPLLVCAFTCFMNEVFGSFLHTSIKVGTIRSVD